MTAFVVESMTVEIEAPQAFVWGLLVDYARYPEWNPYTVRVETTLEIGSVIDLYLPDPAKPGETFRNREYLRVVDAPHHLRYDTAEEIPGMHAVRDQWVVDLGAGRSSYRTTDAFTGEVAGYVFEHQDPWVKAGFDSVAHALKARAEALHRACPPLLRAAARAEGESSDRWPRADGGLSIGSGTS